MDLKERVLVTTLTKKHGGGTHGLLCASIGINVRYLHSRDRRPLSAWKSCARCAGATFDVLVGINLLREGLDLPEVSLVAILDADKEGYLRSERSLIQTIGRAARNVNGRVILYADGITKSMRAAIDETNRRRAIQQAHNLEHGITPQTIQKAIGQAMIQAAEADYVDLSAVGESAADYVPLSDIPKRVAALRKEMREAASALEFERAADLRDEIQRLQVRELDLRGGRE